MEYTRPKRPLIRELRDLIIFGDTQTLELMQGCLLAFLNTYQLKILGDSCSTKIRFGFDALNGCQYAFYILAVFSVFTGLGILYSSMTNNLDWRLRLFRIYWALCISIASLIFVCNVQMPSQYYINYLIQFVFAFYTLLKLSHEHISIFARRSHGK